MGINCGKKPYKTIYWVGSLVHFIRKMGVKKGGLLGQIENWIWMMEEN